VFDHIVGAVIGSNFAMTSTPWRRPRLPDEGAKNEFEGFGIRGGDTAGCTDAEVGDNSRGLLDGALTTFGVAAMVAATGVLIDACSEILCRPLRCRG
jgi:hypothetical protein